MKIVWTSVRRTTSDDEFCCDPVQRPGLQTVPNRVRSHHAAPISHEVIVNLIASTSTETGLTVRCELDKSPYPKGLKVSDKELAQINIKRHEFHGEWNYIMSPRIT